MKNMFMCKILTEQLNLNCNYFNFQMVNVKNVILNLLAIQLG